MKCLERNRYMLHVLHRSNCKLHKAIVSNCSDDFIQTLAEIVHNILNGNISLNKSLVNKLKKYKKQLQRIYQAIRKKRSTKQRRKIFTSQTGGFWPLLIEAALSGLATYVGQKIANNVVENSK